MHFGKFNKLSRELQLNIYFLSGSAVGTIPDNIHWTIMSAYL